jgi:hypothetical protein
MGYLKRLFVDERFECPGCGGLSSTSSATARRDELVVDFLHVAPRQWARFRSVALKSPSPVRTAALQRITSLSLDDANDALFFASHLRLLAEAGSGYRPAVLYCPACYNRAIDVLQDDLDRDVAREEAQASAAVENASRVVRDPIPARLRFEVLNRDNFRCRYCGRSQRDGAVLHVDHVVPFSKGGPTTEDNLITACSDCNLGKSDRPVLPT